MILLRFSYDRYNSLLLAKSRVFGSKLAIIFCFKEGRIAFIERCELFYFVQFGMDYMSGPTEGIKIRLSYHTFQKGHKSILEL